jgi:hypothetical protein
MTTAASPTSLEERKEDDKKKKLTKVLSTKLSVEDYIRFQKVHKICVRGWDDRRTKNVKILEVYCNLSV